MREHASSDRGSGRPGARSRATPGPRSASRYPEPAPGARLTGERAREPVRGEVLEQPRVHVRVPADRRPCGRAAPRPLEHAVDATLARAHCPDARRHEQQRGRRASRPTSGSPSRELPPETSRRFVDVGRGHRLDVAVVVDVLEQPLAGQFVTLADDLASRESRTRRCARCRPCRERQLERVAADPHVTVRERRRAVGAVLLRVLVVADAQLRLLHQRDDRGDDLALAQALQRRSRVDRAADLGQRATESTSRKYFTSSRTCRQRA